MNDEMRRALLLGVSHVLTNAPYFVLVGALLWGGRRRSKRVTVIGLTALGLAQGVSSFILMMLLGAGSWTNIQFAFFCVSVITVLMLLFRVSFYKALYCFLLIRAVYITITYVVLNAFKLAQPGVYIGFDSTPLYTLAVIAGTMLVFPLLWRFITGSLRAAFSELGERTIAQLCVAPVLFFVLDQCYSSIRNALGYDGVQLTVIFLLILLTGLATYYISLRMVLDSARYTRIAAQASIKEQSLAADNLALDSLNRMKTEFIQDISHEMKNPLTVIATGIDFADRQSRKSDVAPEISEAFNTVRDETQRLGRMIDGMADLASMDARSENRRRVSLAALLQNSADAFHLTFEQRNNRLTVAIAENMPDVFIENDRFVQVMTNIFSNAAEHTRNGRIVLTADFDDAYITVRVDNTGESIPPELLPHVFLRGVSGRGGTGYGLYLCKAIVEAHGGTITIENAPEESGVSVSFTVPVYGGQEAGHEL